MAKTVIIPDPPPPAATKPFEQWAKEKGTSDWALACARGANGWPQGREMTEAAFDDAVEAGAKLKILPP